MITVRMTAPVGRRTIELFAELDRRAPNFAASDGPFDAAHGWRVDDRCGPLPEEAPGAPEPDGPFEAACEVLRCYQMADPSIVRAAYDPSVPLLHRDMALEGRFSVLRFPMGVRVTDVVDDTTTIEGRPVRRWGWGYSTLDQHLEQGRMDWEVWKWLDSGAVEFRIHAFSRRGPIRNPVVALGFALFGPRTQERFYAAAGHRMRRLVEERTGRETTSTTCHTAVERPLLGAAMGPARRDRDTHT